MNETLTDDERKVLELLLDAHIAYLKLTVQHPMHTQEWAMSLHQLQRLVMSRPVARQEGWIKTEVSTAPPVPVANPGGIKI